MSTTDAHDPSVSKVSPLRFGILGLGRAGSAFVRPILSHPGTTITAAADLRPDTRERFAQDVPAELYASPEELCSSASVDVVYVATPTQFHTEHVLLAMQHGKHVLVAKPMATTLRDAEVMLEAAERAGVTLVEAHPQSMDPPVLGMRSIVERGELGRLRMIHNWQYGAWLYQPRTPEELDTALGGGATFRQGAHQFDILRLIGGGLVRSVRAMTGAWDPERPTEGAHVAFLDFEDGTVATAVFNGYDHFHSSELTFGIGQGGSVEDHAEYAASRRARQASDAGKDAELKKLRGYGQEESRPQESAARHQPFYGLTIVSCEDGDIRQSADGLIVYGKVAKIDAPLPASRTGRDGVLDEVYGAVVHGEPAIHDGEWSTATLELTLAVLESGRTRAEVFLKHQVPLKRDVSALLSGQGRAELATESAAEPT